jgi:hypothetical protein
VAPPTTAALDTAALGLPAGTLASILVELPTIDGRLELTVDRLADALDPASMAQGR